MISYTIIETAEGKWNIVQQLPNEQGILATVDSLGEAETWIEKTRTIRYESRPDTPFGTNWEVYRRYNNEETIVVVYKDQGAAGRMASYLNLYKGDEV